MIHGNTTRRRGFIVLTAVAGLLVLMVVAALFLQYGLQGLRQEHMQDISAQCDQIVLSLRDLSRRDGRLPGGEMREIEISELLAPGTQGAAWLGAGVGPSGAKTIRCRIELDRGRDRIDRVFEWPAN